MALAVSPPLACAVCGLYRRTVVSVALTVFVPVACVICVLDGRAVVTVALIVSEPSACAVCVLNGRAVVSVALTVFVPVACAVCGCDKSVSHLVCVPLLPRCCPVAVRQNSPDVGGIITNTKLRKGRLLCLGNFCAGSIMPLREIKSIWVRLGARMAAATNMP